MAVARFRGHFGLFPHCLNQVRNYDMVVRFWHWTLELDGKSYLKVSKSRKQFLDLSILPKIEQKSKDLKKLS